MSSNIRGPGTMGMIPSRAREQCQSQIDSERFLGGSLRAISVEKDFSYRRPAVFSASSVVTTGVRVMTDVLRISSCTVILFWAMFCTGVLAAQDEASVEKTEAEMSSDEQAEDDNSTYEPATTKDPQIPLDQLKIAVKPLTKDELQIEADAWLDLLRETAKQIAVVQLGVKKTNEAMAGADAGNAESDNSAELQQDTQTHVNAAAREQKEDLLATGNELKEARIAIADRLEVVLVSLEAKGGEPKMFRDYSSAVSGIDLDARDASATWAAITGWLASKEGGQRWTWNIAIFFTILIFTWIASRVVAFLVNWLLDRKVALSALAEKLISRTIKHVIMLIGFAIALTALEIDITPILAAIGAAGFIIGFALQGTLSNFASGLMILLNRPFDEGDVVNAGSVTGTVKQMNLVSTTFRTFDNQTIYVPNNEIWGSVITNITANDERRVDMEFGIGYEDDFEDAERIIREVVSEHELILADPEPQVVMHELADSCVNIVCRPWAKTSDWWTVKTEVTRRVKQRFDAAGISIPYPQRDVHVYQHAVQTAGKVPTVEQ